jgi:hypothetical protein
LTNSANYRLPGIGTLPQDGSPGTATSTIEQLPATEPTEETCECGHPRAQHDVIAARYCVATTAGSLDRGCVCPG